MGGANHFNLVARELSWLENHKDTFRRAFTPRPTS
jgi:hypothetical protein